MIIVSASMPRSASGYYYRLTEELLLAGGIPVSSTRSLRENLGMKLPVKYDRLEWWKLIQIAKVGLNNTFPIKTHHAPTATLKYFMAKGRFRATYIYRDPRDVIVSALELGKKLREKGNTERYFRIGPYRSFARFYTLEGAIRWVNWQLYPRWKKWTNCRNVLTTKYENLILDKLIELRRLADFLEIKVDDDQLKCIIKKYEPDSSGKIQGDFWRPGRGYLLNKGIIGRYKKELSQKEQELCWKHLKTCLTMMGYNE
jgi:hypothetical protein